MVCYERVGEAYRISTTLTIQTHGLGQKKTPAGLPTGPGRSFQGQAVFGGPANPIEIYTFVSGSLNELLLT